MNNLLKIVLLSLICMKCSAQDTTRHWSLQDCLNYAKAHNISLQQAQTDVQIAKDQQLAAKGQLLPSLSANAAQNYNIGLSIDPITNQKKNQTTRSNDFSIGANWTLFDGFYIWNNIKKASWNTLASQYLMQQQAHRLTIQIINDYLQILLNVEMLQAAKRQLALSKKFHDDMKIQLEAGEKSKADFADATAQWADDRQQKIMAENNVKIARRNLAQDLQLHQVHNFRILYAIPVSADSLFLDQSLEDIYTAALNKYPAIKQGKAEIKGATYNWRMSKSSLWPSVGFSSGVNTLYSDHYLDDNGRKVPFSQQFDDNLGYYFSFNLNIPIFNKLYNRASIHIAEKAIRKAELEAEQSRSDLWQAVQTVYSNVRLYHKAFKASQKAEQALKDALHYADVSYHSGNIAYYSYLQTRNRFLNAQSTAIQNKYQYLYNALLLKFYYQPNFLFP